MSESDKKVKNNSEENKNKNFKLVILISVICFVVLCATIITIVAITSSKDNDKTKGNETIDIYGSDKHARDEKILDEVIAMVKNCIAYANISDVEVVETTYIYNGNQVTSNKSEGDDFAKLIEMNLNDGFFQVLVK